MNEFSNKINQKRVQLQNVIPLSMPYALIIDTCGLCNFNCKFCAPHTSNIISKHLNQKMSFSLFKKIVDDVSSFGESLKKTSLCCHGEPLLNKDLSKMILYAKEKNCMGHISLATNGSLLNYDLSQQLVESGIDAITISIEALDSAGYLTITGIEIDYNLFLENISNLYKLSRGKSEIHIKIISDSVKTNSEKIKFKKLFGAISDYLEIENIIPMWSSFDKIKNSIDLNEKKGLNDQEVINVDICPYPFYTSVILSDGSVTTCCVDWKADMVLGNIYENSLASIWNGKKLREFQIGMIEKRTNGIYKNCLQCNFKNYCCNDNIDLYKNQILDRLLPHPIKVEENAANYLSMSKKLIENNIETVFKKKQEIFDALSQWSQSKNKYICIFGAGMGGMSFYEHYKKLGIKIDYFCDNNQSKHGSAIVDDILCISPEQLGKLGDAVLCIIVIGSTELENIYVQLTTNYKMKNIIKCPQIYILDEILNDNYNYNLSSKKEEVLEKIDELFSILYDDESKKIAYLKLKFIFSDIDDLNGSSWGLSIISNTDQYFINNGKYLKSNEIIMDCGSYNGDTLDYLLSNIKYDTFEKYICYEPDNNNYLSLNERIAQYPDTLRKRIATYNVGVGLGRHNTTMNSGEIISLDTNEFETKVTFLKMDIEGYEMDALIGAKRLIKECKPQCAVCVYHKISDLWEIPLYLHSLLPEHKILLRHHLMMYTETVCYALENV